MSEIKLFRLNNGIASEIGGEAGGLEKSLQTLIENNLEPMLAVRFLSSEHFTGNLHKGRIDTLGLDENGCPVILEYKRAISENVINQGLYYLDWLLDHKGEFKLLVLDRYGKSIADDIDWTAPRLICVAADFTKHDEHAVRQINRNIDLIRYRRFGQELLALELLTSTTADAAAPDNDPIKPKASKQTGDKPVSQALAEIDSALRDVWEGLRAFVLGLGGDISEKQLKLYVAFRRIKNFVTVAVQRKGMYVYLRLDPSTVALEDGFSRDVTRIGHWGTGNLEIWINDKESLKKAQPLIVRAYEEA
jgi:predicted transport protein